jgi:hypothetical protein
MYNAKDVAAKNISYYSGGNSTNKADIPTIFKTAMEQGPDGALNYITQAGPPGSGMSEHWRAFQSAAEDFAIWTGHPENIPHVIEWVAQLSHQGAVSNLIAADQALLRGDVTGAGGLLMRAHAFAPDGSYARTGTDKKGTLWVEQFSEATGERLGKPFPVSHEDITRQIIALQHPVTYAETLQKHQLGNADIILKMAHAKSYADLPEARRAMADQAAQVREDAIEQRREAAKQHDETLRLGIDTKAETARGNTEAATRPIDTFIEKQIEAEPTGPLDPKDNKTPIFRDPERANAVVEAQKLMMYPERAGGAGMNSASAKLAAINLGQGKWKAKASDQKDAAGDPVRYGLVDDNGNPHGYLSAHTVGRMMNIPGMGNIMKPGLPPAQASPTPQQHTSAVGIGAGSSSAMQLGYNQNLSGLPIRPLPQQQPQQSMVG